MLGLGATVLIGCSGAIAGVGVDALSADNEYVAVVLSRLGRAHRRLGAAANRTGDAASERAGDATASRVVVQDQEQQPVQAWLDREARRLSDT